MGSREVTYAGEIVPELKGWHCADLDPTTLDEDEDEVFFAMELDIGEPGSNAADIFQVCVATPAGLPQGADRRRRPPPIVVHPYRWESVLAEIQRRLDLCRAMTWQGTIDGLRRQFKWEYEGMSR